MGKKINTMTADPKEKILAAAREVFTRKGYAASSMREIAEAAGVNKGLLHYYNWNKRKLFQCVFEEAFNSFALRINETFYSDRPLPEKIETFVEQYLDLLLKNPHLPGFVISELNQHPEEFIANILRQKARPDPTPLLVQVQLEGQAGRIREVNPFHFFLNLISMCVFPFLARPMVQNLVRIDDETYANLMRSRKREIVDFVLNALKPG